MEEENCKNVSA